ncbi:hypothetical protein IU452_37275 [Nocardia transvalensis]|nr:hypothetical protein [Nocardia transvalensis]
MRRFAATTPGVLVALAVTAVALCLISALVCANELSGKTARRDAALQRSEPLADAAQRLYVALSTADASAAAAFLSGGIESPQMRAQYQQALADAADALATATAGAGDAQTRTIVARIAAELPAYTGLVESARANNRQGLPVGSAYLREASGVMQDSLLPNAARLTAERLAAVRDDQRAITRPPWFASALLFLVIAVAVGASRILLQRTNRRFNPGVVFAASAAVLALLWILVATVVARGAIDTGPRGPTARSENVAQARIFAQQARTNETLQLITRGDTTDSENDFNDKLRQLNTRLEAVAPPNSSVRQQFSQWADGHRRQLEAYNAADYRAAVEQAIGAGPDSSARHFAVLDESLRDGLLTARTDLREQIDAAGDSWIGAAAGTLVLMVLAAAGVVAGLWPRLKEFL